ncbi:DUF3180 domain-containing protein [Salinibacterium sp. SYSU T00001]|uniref:DUF3180 domain-containing protein n=1 Tax=Homoserinimonas sedimenticola TaxID=2986805 RepID=UPI002235D608|nr:DUF3180 domain-containing protein [Salinibacterium sedimenticola]MCW4385404.1 DUF3180 domain-containing protein [Salinibacterium sedimenticola]
MKRTTVSLVLLLVAVGAAGGLLAQQALASAGRPTVTPPVSLTIVLVAIGLIVVGLAVPVRRAVRGNRARVDPFYALRVLVLAKASALAGALLGGAAAGSVVFLLTRTVPALGSVGYSIGVAVGALILLAGGLIAEEMCRIPPPSDEDEEEAAGATS